MTTESPLHYFKVHVGKIGGVQPVLKMSGVSHLFSFFITYLIFKQKTSFSFFFSVHWFHGVNTEKGFYKSGLPDSNRDRNLTLSWVGPGTRGSP